MNPKRPSAAHHMFRSIMAMVLVLVMVAGNSFVITAGAAGDKPAQEPKQTFEIEIGETITLPVYDDVTTFESSDEAVASVTQNGDVTGIGAGTATITVTSTKGRHGIKFWEWGKKLITVFEIVVKEPYMELEPEVLEIEVGEYIVLSDGKSHTSYLSSNDEIVKVQRDGMIIGVAAGTATVTATSRNGRHFFQSKEHEQVKTYTIIVNELSVDPVSGEKAYHMKVGETLNLYINEKKVYWSSSDDSIALVSPDGTITGATPGTCVITAKYKGGHSGAFWNHGKLKNAEQAQTFNIIVEKELQQFDVNFLSEDKVSVARQTVLEGDCATEPEIIEKEGYTFEGWYTDDTYGTLYDFTLPVKSNLDLYGKWTINSYTVSFNTAGGRTIETQHVQYQGTATEPAEPVKSGCTFAGWYTEETFENEFDFANEITSNIVLYAKWEFSGQLELSLSQTETIAGSSETVYFYATIYGTASNIFLINADTDEQLIQLVDDGQYSVSGDDLPNDNVYSGMLTLDTSSEKTLQFYAKTDGEEQVESNTVTFKVYRSVTEKELQNMSEVDNSIQEDIFNDPAFDGMSIEERKTLAEECLEELASQNLIVEDSILYDEEDATFTFVYDSDALGLLILHDWDDNTDGGKVFEASALPDSALKENDTKDEQTTMEQDIIQVETEEDEPIPEEPVNPVIPEEELVEIEETEEDVSPDEEQPEVKTDDEESTESTSPDESTDIEGEESTAEETEKTTEVDTSEDVSYDETDNSEQTETDDETKETENEETNEKEDIYAERARISAENSLNEMSFAEVAAFNESNEGDLSIGKAIVLWSFNQKKDKKEERVPFYEEIEVTWTEKGLDTTIDWDVTIEDYKRLNGYDVIVVSGHGEYCIWKCDSRLLFTIASGLILSEDVTTEKNSIYASDLHAYRIGISHVSGGPKYAILPNFFTYYYGNGSLDGSFVFIQNCQSYGKSLIVDHNMAQSILSSSAESVVGFHNSVQSEYGRRMTNTYVQSLIAGKTSEEALDAACGAWGNNDYDFCLEYSYTGDGTKAYPILSGDSSARLVDVGFKNGDFEEGSTLSGWSHVGDTRVVTQLGSLQPQKNQRMAILTTGIGSAEKDYLEGTEGSVISQKIILPESADNLCFCYDVVSEEPMEYVNTEFDDTFCVEIVTSSGTYELMRKSVNDAEWYEIDGIDFDGGDKTTYHTKWTTTSIDISDYAGTIVEIRFSVYDMGDSLFDTAVLLDNVSIEYSYSSGGGHRF